MRKLALLALLVTSLTVPAFAGQNAIPRGHVWRVIECETWNCATSAMIMANGDSSVFSLPTNSNRYKWVVLKREHVDSAYWPPQGEASPGEEPPFLVEEYDTTDQATNAHASHSKALLPMLVTAPDGRVLVIRLREAETTSRRRP